MTTVVDRLWTDARLVTLSPDRGGLGIVERGAVATSGELFRAVATAFTMRNCRDPVDAGARFGLAFSIGM